MRPSAAKQRPMQGDIMTSTLPKRSEVQIEYTWDLDTIYPNDAAWEQDFSRVSAVLPELAKYQGRLGESAQPSLNANPVRDDAGNFPGRLFVYANLRLQEDTTNPPSQALAARPPTLPSEFATATAYQTPEILSIPQEKLDAFL